MPIRTGRRLLAAGLAGFALPASAVADGDGLAANKAVVRRVLDDVQRDGDFDAFESLFAADYTDHTPFPGFARDRGGTRLIYQTFRAAFPGFAATVHRQIAEDDLVTSHKTYGGVHRGDFMGIPPTGRAIRFEVIDIMRVRNGQITDHWGVADVAGLLRQLGAR